VETVNVSILEKDLGYAQSVCANISDADKRERAMANVIGAKIASGFFSSQDYTVDAESGIHNLGTIVEVFDIADLYVNNAYVDVRVYFQDDELKIPEMHFKTGILPTAYMFIKLGEDLRSGEVMGFILPKMVDKSNAHSGMIILSETDLSSFEQIKDSFNDVKEYTEDLSEDIYEFLEGSLEPVGIVNLIKHLVKSKNGRIKLLKAIKAQSVFNIVSDSFVQATDANSQSEAQIETTEDSAEVVNEADDLDGLFEMLGSNEQDENESQNQAFEYSTEITPSGAELIESLDSQIDEQALDESENIEQEDQAVEENSEDIETLFTNESNSVKLGKKKNSSFALIFVLLLVLSGAGIYFWYTNMNNQPQEISDNIQTEAQISEDTYSGQPEADVMPVETVEKDKIKINKEEGNSATVAAIERNLDSSILVSNLKVDWEVPAGYASNTAAKRYLIKLGKIIQLNLKTELLLLSKPPLSNKITVELTYNPTIERFELVGIKDSSGEKTVDDTILSAIKTALGYKISSNVASFAKLQGNPILVIRL